jgi:hypothetical protein
VDNAFISPFKTQTMHIKSFNTQQHCYISLKTLHPGGIRTRVFLFLRWMRCPLRHVARAMCSMYAYMCDTKRTNSGPGCQQCQALSRSPLVVAIFINWMSTVLRLEIERPNVERANVERPNVEFYNIDPTLSNPTLDVERRTKPEAPRGLNQGPNLT